MTKIKVEIPEELKHKMETFEEINWSAVARESFKRKISDLELLREFKSNNKLTKQDALRMGRKVNEALAKLYV